MRQNNKFGMGKRILKDKKFKQNDILDFYLNFSEKTFLFYVNNSFVDSLLPAKCDFGNEEINYQFIVCSRFDGNCIQLITYDNHSPNN